MSKNSDNIQAQLADIEAIKQLKSRYAMACDDNYNPEELAAMFTDDAIWDGGEFGCFRGRAAIYDYFSAMVDVVDWALHYMSNPVIEVDGNDATGRWYLWQPMVLKEGSQAVFLGAHYHDRYVKVEGRWLFQEVRLDVKFFSPYEEGFGKVRMMPLPV